MSSLLQPVVDLPIDVIQFAEASGLNAELQHVVAMTHDVFPGDSIRLEIEDDPEIADRHITIFVAAHADSAEKLVAAQWRWSERLLSCCPGPSACVFRLATEAVS